MEKFDENEWEMERSSGFLGYRNINTGQWIYDHEYDKKVSDLTEKLKISAIMDSPECQLHYLFKFEKLFHDVLNMGMTLRQDQLRGFCEKSGNEMLEEFLTETKDKLRNGINICE